MQADAPKPSAVNTLCADLTKARADMENDKTSYAACHYIHVKQKLDNAVAKVRATFKVVR